MANATSTIKFYSTIESKLTNLPIENGNLIFVRDSRKICLDTKNERVEYSTVIVVKTEQQRQAMKPVTGFYFVNETSILWRCEKGEWNQITAQPKTSVYYFNDIESLPKVGQENSLYVTMNNIYRWNGNTYNTLGGSEWGQM